ncbi:MAG: aminoglycoside phosphotransferase family protein [Burkholderiaceae bacterium]
MQHSPDIRRAALHDWLSEQPALRADPSTLTMVAGDASFRRYFRVQTNLSQHASLILMDAPPPVEDIRPFVQVAELLAATGVSVPQVLVSDADQGFLALSDLGDRTYATRLNSETADDMYRLAGSALLRMQTALMPAACGLPAYDAVRLGAEMQLFVDWYVNRHLETALTAAERPALQTVFDLLTADALAQPQVFVHRDYHSRNLMVLDAPAVTPGILDFQDAVIGPLTYDLVSLLRDAYVEWPDEQVLDWAIRYWEKARAQGLPVPADASEFFRQFEWMGLQRHLKVLGIFARLHYRDGKSAYLNDLPRVLGYARRVAERFSVFKPLARLFERLDGQTAQVAYTF